MTPKLPPRYFWLWHLAAMGVIDADYGPLPDAPADPEASALRAGIPAITGTRWDAIAALPGAAEATASVALIDTGTSRRHPNLAGRIDLARSIDLSTHRHGARYAPDPAATPALRERPEAFFTGLSLEGLDLEGMEAEDMAYLQGMVAEQAAARGVVRHLAEPEETVGAHGTACAGLIVGHPALVAGAGPVRIGGAGASPDPNVLPYFGVDPFSTLVSIRTGFEADAEQFILAFLYARQCGVQAIVLPRGLPDPVRSRLDPLADFAEPKGWWKTRFTDDLIARRGVPTEAPDPTGTQTGAGHRPGRGWDVLCEVVIAVSKVVPVFCAAGNDGESQLIYPARLAAPGNGIVAVGAVTPEGYRAGYSNYGDRLTLVMPSDDFEVLNRHQSRIDRTDPLLGMHDFDAVGASTRVPFCPLELVSTDLPGVFGYDRGAAPWSAWSDPATNPGVGGGYYTAFGGTSGASCLAGGLALLAQRARRAAGKQPLSGVEMKAAMERSATTLTVVAPGVRALRGDAMNREGEETEPPQRFFGAGLPDARKLIADVLAMP